MNSSKQFYAYMNLLQDLYSADLYLNKIVKYASRGDPYNFNNVGMLIGNINSDLVIVNQNNKRIDIVYPWLLQDVIR